MEYRDIIREALRTREYSQARLAEIAGYSHQSVIARTLSTKKGIHLYTFIKLLEAMDFEIVVRSKTDSCEEWKVSQ